MENNFEKLVAMKGSQFIFRSHPLTIMDVQKGSQSYVVKTDWKTIDIDFDKLEETIKEFLPASNETSLVTSKSFSSQVIGKHAALMVDLKDVLLDNINRVRDNPDYAKQAQVVNKSASTLVSMVALEVQVAKEVGKGN
ncbi:hypothetical protein [Roseivirga seohaensis]|uniref:hypothetical protein n=1 Tax=Roseivirga seohaensis TaxID=1914963 RepID=UPI003BA8E74E